MDKQAHLEKALKARFPPEEATCLAELFITALNSETLSYADIELSCPDKNEYLLTAFEERALIPIHPKPQTTWEERSLKFTPEEKYFMPAVVRCILQYALWTGSLDSAQGLTGVMSKFPAADIEPLVRLIRRTMLHTRSYRFETGLLATVGQGLNFDFDMHEVIDLYMNSGILSPCKSLSMSSGLAWYEINRCLFWEQNKA